jgi:uncharacterized membrane protein YqiK
MFLVIILFVINYQSRQQPTKISITEWTNMAKQGRIVDAVDEIGAIHGKYRKDGAEAAKVEAIGLAQAKAIEAQGLAEATAILRKAEAWKQFNEAAKLQKILEKLPAILQSSSGVFAAVAAPMGNIDKLVVIDQGAASAGGGSPSLERIAKTSPAVVFSLLQQLEALGLSLPAVLQQLGVGAGAGASGQAAPSVLPPLDGAR